MQHPITGSVKGFPSNYLGVRDLLHLAPQQPGGTADQAEEESLEAELAAELAELGAAAERD